MKDTLAQQAYLQLRDRLRTGKLPPGTRLVNRTLAAELGISFTPVREAISRLSSEGLIEHVPGAGAFVKRLTRRDLAQLYDLRATLEPYAAAEAARHISAVELEELGAACAAFEPLVNELRSELPVTLRAAHREAWLGAEERYHRLLIRAARNPWLTKMVVELRLVSLVFSSQLSVKDLLPLEVAERTWADHGRLLEMLAARNSTGAEEWMKAHVIQGRTHVLALFTGDDS
ncbi:MAG: DNA-binding GntR family transcriptional regulator [Planctomycetota bacterium]|jgi:DNA-binding GntR family transcriptional regulator